MPDPDGLAISMRDFFQAMMTPTTPPAPAEAEGGEEGVPPTVIHEISKLVEKIANTLKKGENLQNTLTNIDQSIISLLDLAKGKGGGGGASGVIELDGTNLDKATKNASGNMKKIRSDSEKMLDALDQGGKNLLSNSRELFGIGGTLISLYQVGQALQSASKMMGSLATQFQVTGASARQTFVEVGDAAAKAGENIEKGAQAFDNLREAGVRSVKELNATLKTTSSAVLMIGGDMGSWADQLGTVSYELQFSSKQVSGLVRGAALTKRQFALTTKETQKVLSDTTDIVKTMQRMGTASAAVTAQITKMLAATRALKAGESLNKVIEGLTSFQKFNEASGETRMAMLRMVGREGITAFDIMSGQLMSTKEGMEKFQRASAAMYRDVLAKAENMSAIQQQIFIKTQTGIEGGIEELRRTTRATEIASMSLEEAQAKAQKALQGGTEAEVRASLEYHLGQKFEGSVSDMRKAADQYLEGMKLQEQVTKAAEAQDLLQKLVSAQAEGPARLSKVFQEAQAGNGELLKEVAKSAGIQADQLTSGNIISLLGKQADQLQKTADTAAQQLEEQKLTGDPMRRLAQVIMGPINKILSTIATGILAIFDFIGPFGVELLGWGILVLGILTAMYSLYKSTFVKSIIAAMKGSALGDAGGAAASTVKDAVTGGGAASAASAAAGGGSAGGIEKITGGLQKVINDLSQINTSDAMKALKVAGIVALVFAAMIPLVWGLRKATAGMDVPAFLAGLAGMAAMVVGIRHMNDVMGKLKVEGLVKGIKPLTLGVLLLTGLALLLRFTLIPAMSGVDWWGFGVSMIGLAFAIGAMAVVAAVLLGVGAGMAALGPWAGLILLGIATMALLFVALSIMAGPLRIFASAMSSVDMGQVASSMIGLAFALGSAVAIGVALTLLSPLILLAPFFIIGSLVFVGLLKALSMMGGPLEEFQSAYSNINGGAIAAAFVSLAIALVASLVVGAALVAISPLFILAPFFAVGALVFGGLLLSLSGLGYALEIFQNAYAGIKMGAIAYAFISLAGALVASLVIGTALVAISPLFILAPFFAVGALVFGGLLLALAALSIPLMIFQEAYAGISIGAIAAAFVGLAIALVASLVVGTALVAISPLFILAPLLIIGAIVLGGLLLVLAALAIPLLIFQAAYSSISIGAIVEAFAGLALTLISASVIGTGLAAMAPLLALAPYIIVGALVFGSLLIVLALLAIPLMIFQAAYSSLNMGAIAEAFAGLAMTLVAASVIGTVISAMSLLWFAALFFGAGALVVASLILVLALLAAPLYVFQAAFSGLDMTAIGESFEGLAKCIESAALIGAVIGAMALLIFAAPLFALGAIVVGGLFLALAKLSEPLSVLGSAFSGIDSNKIANDIMGIKSIMESIDSLSESSGLFGALGLILAVYSTRTVLEHMIISGIANALRGVISSFSGITAKDGKTVAGIFDSVATLMVAVVKASSASKKVFKKGILWDTDNITPIVTTLNMLSRSGLASSLQAFLESMSTLTISDVDQVAIKMDGVAWLMENVALAGQAASGLKTDGGWFSKGEDQIADVVDAMESLAASGIAKALTTFVRALDPVTIAEVDAVAIKMDSIAWLMENVAKAGEASSGLKTEGGWFSKGTDQVAQVVQALWSLAKSDIAEAIGVFVTALSPVTISDVDQVAIKMDSIAWLMENVGKAAAATEGLQVKGGLFSKGKDQIEDVTKALKSLANSDIAESLKEFQAALAPVSISDVDQVAIKMDSIAWLMENVAIAGEASSKLKVEAGWFTSAKDQVAAVVDALSSLAKSNIAEALKEFKTALDPVSISDIDQVAIKMDSIAWIMENVGLAGEAASRLKSEGGWFSKERDRVKDVVDSLYTLATSNIAESLSTFKQALDPLSISDVDQVAIKLDSIGAIMMSVASAAEATKSVKSEGGWFSKGTDQITPLVETLALLAASGIADSLVTFCTALAPITGGAIQDVQEAMGGISDLMESVSDAAIAVKANENIDMKSIWGLGFRLSILGTALAPAMLSIGMLVELGRDLGSSDMVAVKSLFDSLGFLMEILSEIAYLDLGVGDILGVTASFGILGIGLLLALPSLMLLQSIGSMFNEGSFSPLLILFDSLGELCRTMASAGEGITDLTAKQGGFFGIGGKSPLDELAEGIRVLARSGLKMHLEDLVRELPSSLVRGVKDACTVIREISVLPRSFERLQGAKKLNLQGFIASLDSITESGLIASINRMLWAFSPDMIYGLERVNEVLTQLTIMGEFFELLEKTILGSGRFANFLEDLGESLSCVEALQLGEGINLFSDNLAKVCPSGLEQSLKVVKTLYESLESLSLSELEQISGKLGAIFAFSNSLIDEGARTAKASMDGELQYEGYSKLDHVLKGEVESGSTDHALLEVESNMLSELAAMRASLDTIVNSGIKLGVGADLAARGPIPHAPRDPSATNPARTTENSLVVYGAQTS